MAEVKWIKLATDIFDDEKIKIIESLPKADTLLVIWFKLLCLAGKQNNGGVFCLGSVPYTEKMFATILGRPLNTVKTAFEVFENFGMIERIDGTVTIPNWEKHQSLDAYEKHKEKDRLYRKERRDKQRQIVGTSSDKSTDNRRTVDGRTFDKSTDVEVLDKEQDIEEEKERDIRERKSCCRSLKENDNSGDGVTDKSDDPNDRIERWGGELGKGVVYLSQNQFDSLLDILGMDGLNRYLSKLADFIIEKDAKVKNHYGTILRWYEEDSRVKS